MIARVRGSAEAAGAGVWIRPRTAAVMCESCIRCEPLMAVRTHHFALSNLVVEALNRTTGSNQLCDIGGLRPRVRVVEFQHHRVALARMQQEILKNDARIS